MTLLSPLAMLFGLFALVPLVLHLYQRRRRNVILFSTNRFFTDSIVHAQRRLRLRHLLLLLLRIAACLLLAFALARPILTWMGLAAQSGHRDLVILLDDSLSMQAKEPHLDKSRFELAKTIAVDALSRLEAGDRAAVLTFTGRSIARRTRTGLVLTNDVAGLLDAVRRLKPTLSAGDAHRQLLRATQMFEDADQRSRSLLILTDLQKGDWRQSDWPQPDTPIGSLLVALPAPTTDNLVIDHAELAQTAFVAGQPNLLRVRILNHRNVKAEADLVLTVDGKPTARRRVRLLGDSPSIEQVPFVFDTAGEHRLNLHLDCDDALGVDNTFYLSAKVSRRMPVLIVDGGVDPSRRRTAGFFLRTAIAAAGPAGEQVQTDLIAVEDLPSVQLDEYDVVVMSNVGRLSLMEVERLEKFVAGGGGLAVFLGDRCDERFVSELMCSPSRPNGGLLPAHVSQVVEPGEAEAALHLVESELDHPVLQRFKGSLRSALGGVDVYRAYHLAPRAGWVLASMDNSLPLIVEHAFGQGRVVLFATSPQPDWTNLPVRRVFVPLVNRLIGYLSGSGPVESGSEVGDELALLRGGWDYRTPLTVLRPDGVEVPVSVRLQGAEPIACLAPEAVNQAGFYRLTNNLPASDASRLHAVNSPRRESIPDVLDAASLSEYSGRWRAHVVRSDAVGRDNEGRIARQIDSLLTDDRSGLQIWNVLLWTVLVIVMFEPLFADWAGRFLSGGSETERS